MSLVLCCSFTLSSNLISGFIYHNFRTWLREQKSQNSLSSRVYDGRKMPSTENGDDALGYILAKPPPPKYD